MARPSQVAPTQDDNSPANRRGCCRWCRLGCSRYFFGLLCDFPPCGCATLGVCIDAVSPSGTADLLDGAAGWAILGVGIAIVGTGGGWIALGGGISAGVLESNGWGTLGVGVAADRGGIGLSSQLRFSSLITFTLR